MSKIREAGYYWVRAKRTKVWMIAKWWPSLNKGKGFWDTMKTIENDIRWGFDMIDERRIRREDEESWLVESKIKRTRNDTKPKNKEFSKPQRKRTRF